LGNFFSGTITTHYNYVLSFLVSPRHDFFSSSSLLSQLEDFKVAQKEQQQQIEKEISSRERDINCLKHFRSRCADIVSSPRVSVFNYASHSSISPQQESEYLDKMASQKIKSDATIKELETEITALTEQLIQSHQQTSHYDDLMKQTAVLQNSMQDLESQNDILRRTIEVYEKRFGELQVDFEKIQFEVGIACVKRTCDNRHIFSFSRIERTPHHGDRQH
jgi:chromosome segregation ATPase